MRIGELARDLGVSADTLRFYERAGLLPRAQRTPNGYRDYGTPDIDRLRLLTELRRLDIPMPDAARIAGWCQSGHCAETTVELPRLIAERRALLRARMTSLRRLDERLAELERHISLAQLPMAGESGPCCAIAAALERH